jgi:hypothetical protein
VIDHAADMLAAFRGYAPGPVAMAGVARHLERAIAPQQLGPDDFVTALPVDFAAESRPAAQQADTSTSPAR